MASKQTQGKKKSGGRILELDAIRALTCLNLLFFHFTYVYQYKYGFASDLGFSYPYGKYGVQLFFMLSGLVNALTLLKKRQTGNFIISRCIRILPSYWLVVLLNVFLFSALSMYNHGVRWDETIANLTTMPQLFGYENMEPVTWTLQVEMLFYLFLMSTFALGWLDRPLRTMMVAVSVCLVCCSGFDWFRNAWPESGWNPVFHVVDELFFMRNLPLFAMGILLNELRQKRGNPVSLWLGIITSGVVFHLIDLRNHNPVATFLMMGMLTAAAYGRIPILRLKPLVFISFISYPLYLFHNNLGSAFMKWVESLGVAPLPTVIIATLASIAIATAVTLWFEQPLTAWLRKRLIMKPKTATPAKREVIDQAKGSRQVPLSEESTATLPVAEKESREPIRVPSGFDSSECLEEVIEAEKLREQLQRPDPDQVNQV